MFSLHCGEWVLLGEKKGGNNSIRNRKYTLVCIVHLLSKQVWDAGAECQGLVLGAGRGALSCKTQSLPYPRREVVLMSER